MAKQDQTRSQVETSPEVEAVETVVEAVTEVAEPVVVQAPVEADLPVDVAGNPIQATTASVVEVQRVASGDELEKQSVVEAKLRAIEAPIPSAPAVPQAAAAPQDAFSSLTRLSPIGSMVVANLRDYIVKMRPGAPMSVTEGVKHQSALSRTLKMLVNNVQGEEFVAVFTAVLASFAEHRRGVFGETAVFRFPEHQKESAEDRAAIQALLGMLILLAPVPTRQQALKQISLVRVLNYPMFTDLGRERVMKYFGQ